MLVSQVFSSSESLKAADLQGRTYKMTIKEVQLKKFDEGSKLIVKFTKGTKTLVLNKTNSMEISLAYGDDTDKWVGKEIEVFPATTQYQGSTVPCIRVRPMFPPAAAGEIPGHQRQPAKEIGRGPINQPGVTDSFEDLDDSVPF